MADDYQWAHDSPSFILTQMKTVAELEALGYVKVKQHHWYKDTWLMKKSNVTNPKGDTSNE